MSKAAKLQWWYSKISQRRNPTSTCWWSPSKVYFLCGCPDTEAIFPWGGFFVRVCYLQEPVSLILQFIFNDFLRVLTQVWPMKRKCENNNLRDLGRFCSKIRFTTLYVRAPHSLQRNAPWGALFSYRFFDVDYSWSSYMAWVCFILQAN